MLDIANVVGAFISFFKISSIPFSPEPENGETPLIENEVILAVAIICPFAPLKVSEVYFIPAPDDNSISSVPFSNLDNELVLI